MITSYSRNHQGASRRKEMVLLTLCCAIMLTFIACNSNNLSRRKAASLIEKNQSLPKVVTTEIFKEYLKKELPQPPVQGFGTVTLCLFEGPKFSDHQELLQYWQKNGLISIEERSTGGTCPALWAIVTLTNEGRKYITNESTSSFHVKAYQLAIDEITGIKLYEQLKVANVNYTLKKISLTPFHRKDSKIITKTAKFELFDDGWRID